ncbi:MAG: YheU family protein [Halioglobus sp.]
MASLLEIPSSRLTPEVLDALLEEFASRDGTDYGEREHSLQEKVAQLRSQLMSTELALLYDGDSEEWDLVSRDQAASLLNG